ncbi:nitrite/sulfite reductase [Calidifontibacter sp. DB0510]|uniref:assimilatory sulfite reductase (ferredoxin) n=1 Tax=Metallococcus carri TaxID=1656884 RepID=A0A967ED19_9MICO|nr:nitrite/sulfite reductase [Metallococcus carri]NOP36874.1 nitrite/sulfite reductase [Calidifontibacter sp. DB2511S]
MRVTATTPTKTHGQWALDEREPLNHNEEFKAEDDGLNVRRRIEEVYAREGFASIAPDDLRGRMRWWGLYTQRRQGIDGGRTASIPPEELDDEYFMLRVRCDGGALSTEQLRVIAGISTEFGRDTADITDRQNIQLHWIRIEDVPEIWRRLEAVELSTTEACGDCPRVLLGSPVAGVSAEEVIDATPAIREISRRWIGDPTISNLPRKFKTAISWLPDTAPEINDVSFVGVVHPELGPGFDVLVGGGLSTNPKLAVRLGAFATLEEVPDVWRGVVEIFRDYGYRRLRHRARIKFLVQDWGPEKFREVLETEYLGRRLADGPAAPVSEVPMDHIGVHEQTDGLRYVGFAPVAGRVSGAVLSSVADAAEAAGSQRVRLTPYQKLLVLDVAEDRVEPLIETMRPLGLEARPTPWRRSVMACTGLEFCKLAIVETKQRARDLVDELEQRLDGLGLDTPVSIHLNGCPNSCARIQTADIGLKGQIVTVGEEQVEGFQVHLGGGLGADAGFGRKLRALKVTSAELGDYVERVVRRFDEQRVPGERFAEWVQRAEEADLR